MLIWLGQSAFRVAPDTYIDPYSVKKGSPAAKVILVSHEHYDHCSPQDIEKIIAEGTVILANARAAAKLGAFGARVKAVKAGEKHVFGELAVETVPAYSVTRTAHPRENGGLGFIITASGKRIYHAGDTDLIPEMKDIRCDIALLPVGGVFVMDAAEAAEAALLLKPELAIPMHYGSVTGIAADAQKFATLCAKNGIQSKLLQPQ
jgi:L-ascorbate metabolism protein UlaG (beta-lactamase superfamily)